MSRTEQAYEVTCPKCQQIKGHECLYVAPANIDPLTPSWHLTSNQRRQMLRAGQPTKVPHQERFHAYDHMIGRRRWRQMYENTHRIHRAPTEVRAAHKAMVAWDMLEYDRLRRWFHHYGYILGGE